MVRVLLNWLSVHPGNQFQFMKNYFPPLYSVEKLILSDAHNNYVQIELDAIIHLNWEQKGTTWDIPSSDCRILTSSTNTLANLIKKTGKSPEPFQYENGETVRLPRFAKHYPFQFLSFNALYLNVIFYRITLFNGQIVQASMPFAHVFGDHTTHTTRILDAGSGMFHIETKAGLLFTDRDPKSQAVYTAKYLFPQMQGLENYPYKLSQFIG